MVFEQNWRYLRSRIRTERAAEVENDLCALKQQQEQLGVYLAGKEQQLRESFRRIAATGSRKFRSFPPGILAREPPETAQHASDPWFENVVEIAERGESLPMTFPGHDEPAQF